MLCGNPPDKPGSMHIGSHGRGGGFEYSGVGPFDAYFSSVCFMEKMSIFSGDGDSMKLSTGLFAIDKLFGCYSIFKGVELS